MDNQIGTLLLNPYIREYENELIIVKQLRNINVLTGYLNHDRTILHLSVRSVMKNFDELSSYFTKLLIRLMLILTDTEETLSNLFTEKWKLCIKKNTIIQK